MTLPKGYRSGDKRKKSMQVNHIGIFAGIGIVAIVIGLSYYLWYGGACTITECETEIEVTSYNLPSIVDVGEIIRGDFTVKNQGNMTAENCVLHWLPQKLMMTKVLSESFSLLPDKEITINVESLEGANDVDRTESRPGAFSTVWIECDNTESRKTEQSIKRGGYLKP